LLRDNPYATSPAVPSGSGVTAVLDGQQRLLALTSPSTAAFVPTGWNVDSFFKRCRWARVEAMLRAGAEVSGDLD
jgi:vacuolar-type H+-ATPase catalytic subunit A/Vma1